MDIREKVRQLPLHAGVYIMKSASGAVLYVGKASSLRRRVASYFFSSLTGKTGLLREEIADIEYIACDSAQQALIVEAALIKEKKPKYNVSLRDDKSYPYIEITQEDFPRIFIARPKASSRNIFFGPYPKAGDLKAALELIRKIFPYCSCSRGCAAWPLRPKKPCLYYHLHLCPAPCAGKISAAVYRNNVNNICRILKGERKKLVAALTAKMGRLSKEKKFEAAASLRDTITAIDALYRGKPKEHAILSLKEELSLSKVPLAIEAIDISSLGRHDAVGSVVVFKDGLPDKKNYRRFKIKTTLGIDDYAMMAEVVKRRYSRIAREKKEFPDLLVIDGGQGHVGKAASVLKDLGIDIAIIGLAKKNEEIWPAGNSRPLYLSRDKPCLHLLQSIRDEAHRFANAYQFVRRRKALIK